MRTAHTQTFSRVVFWGSLVILSVLISIIAPHVVRHNPITVDLSAINQPPSAEYILGTDSVGRCILCRIMAGTQSTLAATFIAVIACFGLGSILGAASGYIGGTFDAVFMRITDAFMAFPRLVFSIAVAGLLGGGLVNVIIALIVPGWTRFARLARGQVLAMKGRTFVQAERIGGLSHIVLSVKHIVPNIAPPLVVTACLDFGAVMLDLAGLSFLGLGATPPDPELGSMINQAAATFQLAPWGVFAPGVVIFVLVLILNMFGDAVNDHLVSDGKNSLKRQGKHFFLRSARAHALSKNRTNS